MANITVKNIPDGLYAKLKAAAERNRRSINSEIIHYIEVMVDDQLRRSKEEMLAYAALLRERTAAYVVTNEELQEMIDEDHE